MEKKNITMYVLLVLIGFIVIIGLLNSFRTSRSIANAKASIDSVIVHIDRSNTILKAQELTIDSIRNTNENLIGAINAIDASNHKTTETLNNTIRRENRKLDSIIAIVDRVEEKVKPK